MAVCYSFHMKREEIQNAVIRIVRERLDESYKIFLFGSWARGDALPQSDLDIGIYGEQEVPWSEMAHIRHAVDELPTLRKIDVVDLRAKSASFRDATLSYAKPLALTV